MKLLTRNFTTREKVLILILSLILLALLYYKFVDVTVREGIKEAETELETLDTEYTLTAAKLNRLRGMDEELETAKAIDDIGTLYAYSNEKAEVTLLNDILSQATYYSISMNGEISDGTLVRRSFSLEYTAVDYTTACTILSDLAYSPYRCRIIDANVQPESKAGSEYITSGGVTVQLDAVFYETTASLEE